MIFCFTVCFFTRCYCNGLGVSALEPDIVVPVNWKEAMYHELHGFVFRCLW